MGYRLSKIRTCTGDDGHTGLADGSRLHKSSPRIVALGEVDELSCALGLALCHPMTPNIRALLLELQQILFSIGAELCLPQKTFIQEEHITHLDAAIETYNAQLPPLENFVLPGGSIAAAHLHQARAICRRAERHWHQLNQTEPSPSLCGIYLNRLSDLLFVLARSVNQDHQTSETLWQQPQQP